MSHIQESLDSLTQILTPAQIIHISLKMLGSINKNITFHSLRTAYLAWKLTETINDNRLNTRNIVVLALYHTLGYFREDTIFGYNPHDTNIDFFSEEKQITSKYVFSCYYLKYMTPLGDDALALENFTQPFNEDMKHFLYQEKYKAIIYLCARISAYLYHHGDEYLPENINEIAPGYFDTEYVRAFNIANRDNVLVEAVKDDNFVDELSDYLNTITFEKKDSEMLEKLLIYFLDFKSTYTVSHAINTSCYALSLGKRMKLNPEELSELYCSAILHDIGKIATPQRILEFPGKLSPEDMDIMKHHVNHSKRILSGHAPEQIIENVYRHHEKLNGTGYPQHLTGDKLNLIQRILTVADITSALNDSRSYKAEFSTDKTKSIITKMTEAGELDPAISKFVLEDFDTIVSEQQYLYKVLCVDFSHVLARHSDYIFDNTEFMADSLIDEAAQDKDSDDLDNMAELDELEEI
ncbi:HDIG domain-containing protein [Treponema bryantii]|uniref:HDIG domain-containing protein n=1 Tax=Treponema bryantii TaxID=163 RepID=A0A1H9G0C9_9SPIR|nr:HD domain-containing phosphohydrolase [Treponema bryantii]BDC92650.1 HDIG domain-containing protein [Treponema bryantii]SEQ43596.1 HDIG domain-containing protein [Treponema bryantii]